MKIINFSVNNFRCIGGGLDKNKINFSGSNTLFIFGQNNIGKSTMLNAYEFFYNNQKVEEDDFCNKNISVPIEMELELQIGEQDRDQLGTKEQFFESQYLYGDKNDMLKVKKIWKEKGACINKTWNGEEYEEKAFGGVGAHNVFKPLLPKPLKIKAMPSELEIDEILSEIMKLKLDALGEEERKSYDAALKTVLEYQTNIYNSSEIKKYKDYVNTHFQKIFDTIQVNINTRDSEKILSTMEKRFAIEFSRIDPQTKEIVDKNIPTGALTLGHGTIRMALFTLFMLKDIVNGEVEYHAGKKNYLVLFEEPELFLHPKLTRNLRELIYEVSSDETPFQVVCASHSPQMIDISKPKTSLIRMTKNEIGTEIFQVDEKDLVEGGEDKKQQIREILRITPYTSESFYADEVILVEGDTEAILIRGYFQSKTIQKDIFVLNCGSVTNIPFFQGILAKFNIKYHIICDADNNLDANGIPIKGIQKSIWDNYVEYQSAYPKKAGLVKFHINDFESAHSGEDIPKQLRYPYSDNNKDKPLKSSNYWREILEPNLNLPLIHRIPIIKFLEEITIS
jgi:predicted ATP-dependent endonuclease of OLD family